MDGWMIETDGQTDILIEIGRQIDGETDRDR